MTYRRLAAPAAFTYLALAACRLAAQQPAPVDAQALQDAILRLSTLLDVCPEIREIDLNPLKVLAHGVMAVDARIRVEPVTPTSSRRIAY